MAINNNTEKKPFDRSKRFTIYGSWMVNFTKLEKYGVEVPYTLFKGIAEYALFGYDPDFSSFESAHGFDSEMLRDMMEQVYLSIRPNIDTSVKNSKANFADEQRNERELMVVNFKRDHPDASIREIELATGVPKTTVERILKKYATEIELSQPRTNDERQHSTLETDYSFANIQDAPDELPF